MKSDRTWPLPDGAFAIRMTWHDLLFVHWPVEARVLQDFVPSSLQIDTYDGQAWIAIVPFRMSDVAPRLIPAIPGLSAFPELNVRTYVTIDGKPGVWFFSLDATQRIAVRVARRFFHLPYMDARISTESQADWIRYSSQRTHRNERPARFAGRYRPTSDVFYARPDTLEYWLTARYCLYAVDPTGRILRGEIDHPPWPLQNAELEINQNSMLDWLPYDSGSEPQLLFSREVAVRAWNNEVCGQGID